VAPMPRTNWGGNVRFDTARIHRPRTIDELRALVARSRQIRALGSGHSFSAVAAPSDRDGELVLVDGLPPVIEIDKVGGSVTVAAGVRYAELAAALHRTGTALANLASLPHISVAGSCATGTHGSGDGLRCLAAAVRALELVGPDGDRVELRRDTDADTFAGAVVALGALGIVVRLTLDVEHAYRMTQHVRLDVPLDEVSERLDEVFGAAYSVSAFTDWAGGTASVWLKHRAGRSGTGWAGGTAAREPCHPVPGMPADLSTAQLDVVGPWHERLPHFRPEQTPGAGEELQSEYYLPRTAAPAAFAAIRALADRVAPVLQIGEVRTVRGDDLWLSPAYHRESVTFHFTWVPDLPAVRPVIAAVEERLVPLGARPHWGKLTELEPADMLAGYERAQDFERLTHKYDPEGKFRNAYLDGLFARG